MPLRHTLRHPRERIAAAAADIEYGIARMEIEVREPPVHEPRVALVHTCEHRTPRIPFRTARIPLHRRAVKFLPICFCHHSTPIVCFERSNPNCIGSAGSQIRVSPL